MRLYTDLDETLIGAAWAGRGHALAFVLRPWTDVFLSELARRGDVWILTSANRPYAEAAAKLVDPSGAILKGIISDEDLCLVADAIYSGRPARPVAPPGFVFDNYGIDTEPFIVKAAAVGIGPERWIQVEPFGRHVPDDRGLEAALLEFERRVGA